LKAKAVRRNETYQICQAVHGGTDSFREPTLFGMIDTLSIKFKSTEVSQAILSSKKSLTKSLKDVQLKDWTTSYTTSRENKLRSLNMYYSHDVMGKRKFTNVWKENKAATFEGHHVPNYIPYKELALEINSLEIGIVNDANTLLSDNDSDIQGTYREPAQFIQRLAKFYLIRNNERHDKLKEFNFFPKKCMESFLFVLAIGGDGAPGTGTSFLVSFLNCGQRIASSAENFLLFGANVDESAPVVSAFLKKLLVDLVYL